MEKLRKDDFVYAYWLGPGGWTFWLMERQGFLFLQTLKPTSGWTCEQIPVIGDGRIQVDAISKTFAAVGFAQQPVYSDYSRWSGESKERLERQFKIFDEIMQQAQAQEMKQKEGTGNVDADDSGDIPQEKGKTISLKNDSVPVQ